MTSRTFLRSPLGVVPDRYDGSRFRGIISALERTFAAVAEVLNRSPYATKTLTSADSPYTVVSDFNFYVADTSSGNLTIQLPQCTTNSYVWVIKSSVANFVYLYPAGSDTINGEIALRLSALWDGGLFVGVGTTWVRFMYASGSPALIPATSSLTITGNAPTVS